MKWKKTLSTAVVALMMTVAFTGCGGSPEDKYVSQINSFSESMTKIATTYKGKNLSVAEMEKALREGVKAEYKVTAFARKNRKELEPMLKQLSQEQQAYGLSAFYGALDEIDGNLDTALGNSVNKKQMNAAKQKQEEFKQWQKKHKDFLDVNSRAEKVEKAYYKLFPGTVPAEKLVEDAVKRVGNAHQWDPDVNIDKLSFQEIFGVKSVNQLAAKNKRK